MEKGPASPPASPPGTHHQVLTTRSSPPGPHHQCHTTSVSPTILTNPSNSMGGRWSRLCRFNPPAHRNGRQACWIWPYPPYNPSLPGSASPAEATGFTSFFRLFFRLKIFSPKSSPRPPHRLPQVTENHPKIKSWPKKSSQGPLFR